MDAMMKKTLMIMMLLCLAQIAVAQADRVYIEDFEISPDSVVTVPVMLACPQQTRGIQFDMALPQGLELEDMELSNHSDNLGMRLSNRKLNGSNTHAIVLYPFKESFFQSDTSVVVMYISFKALKGFKGGTISLSRIRGSTLSNQSIKMNDASTTVTLLPNTLMRRQQDDDVQDQFFN